MHGGIHAVLTINVRPTRGVHITGRDAEPVKILTANHNFLVAVTAKGIFSAHTILTAHTLSTIVPVSPIAALTKPIGAIMLAGIAIAIEIALVAKHATTTHAAANLLAPQNTEHAHGPALEANEKLPADATSITDSPVASNS